MPDESSIQYLRQLDTDALNATPVTERFSQRLIDDESGGAACMIVFIRTPPLGGSPEGMHVHDFDQHFYILSGTMSFDVDGAEFEGGAGSFMYFPAGVPHRNWNAGTEPTVHLAINAPMPEPGKPIGRRVG